MWFGHVSTWRYLESCPATKLKNLQACVERHLSHIKTRLQLQRQGCLAPVDNVSSAMDLPQLLPGSATVAPAADCPILLQRCATIANRKPLLFPL